MEIILLDEFRFDEYAINHPNYNYYQSSKYGKLMNSHGYNSYYLALVDNGGIIMAATLLTVKNDKNNRRKMGYAPRGFLIDWNNQQLVKEFTDKLRIYLSKRGFTYLKVDPYIIYKEHDENGNEIMNGENNLNFVKNMQNLGYIHMGYNNGLETNNPRWDALTILNQDKVKLFNLLPKEGRDKIIKAAKYGNKVYKGSSNDINLLHSISNESQPLELLADYYQFFSQNNGCEIYFTKLEPAKYVRESKNIYEKEEIKNSELNYKIQDWNNKNKENLINDKLKSDALLAEYKRNMIDAINLFQKYPNGIITSGLIIIKYNKKISIVACNVNETFKEQFPNYLLIWQLIEEFSKKGYEVIDFNGITGNFKNDPNNIEKIELANKIVEYVGEFDLVINKKIYYTGNKLNPILNWLNTPI